VGEGPAGLIGGCCQGDRITGLRLLSTKEGTPLVVSIHQANRALMRSVVPRIRV